MLKMEIKSLYATCLGINFYWAHWIMETRSFVARPTNLPTRP
jgi:hypothetical protein